MDEIDTLGETPEPNADAAFAAFEAQLDPPTEAAPVAPPVEEPKPDAAKVEEPKLDKRTKEGRKASIQSEIDELTKQRRHEERELQRIRAERETVSAPPAAKPAPLAASDGEPDPTDLKKYPDGQYDRQYFKDQARWAANQVIQADRQQREQADIQARRNAHGQTQMTSLKANLAKAGADVDTYLGELPDYLAEMGPSGLLTPEGHKLILSGSSEGRLLAARCAVMDMIVKSEHPKAMLDHYATHESDLQRLLTLPPGDLFWEMGKLEATFSAATPRPSEKVKPISQARPPIKPMGSEPNAPDSDALTDDLPLEEFARRANRQEARQRGRL